MTTVIINDIITKSTNFRKVALIMSKNKRFKQIPSLERNPSPLTGGVGTSNKLAKKVARLLVALLILLVIILVVIGAKTLA